jgi:outer membrane protein OmpA-like peptidoglycan-associated protein
MKSILILFCLSFSTITIGQTLKIKQAEDYFKTYRYYESTPIYKELIQKDELTFEENPELYRHAVISAENSRDFDFKFNTLDVISLSQGYTFDDAFEYFKTSLFVGRFDKAKEILSSDVVINSSDSRKLLLSAYKEGNVWEELLKDTTQYTTSKVSFNSNKGDFNPIYHPDGIAFTSAREHSIRKSSLDNSSYLNLYLASNSDTVVSQIRFLGTNKHDGTAYYDSVNYLWYYSKNLPYDKEVGISRTGIFIFDEGTKEVSEFPYNSKEYFVAQPFLSKDKKILWFSSDMPGSVGGSDIWYSLKEGDVWTKPINAGNVINTSENEMFPFYQDGILYFSSNGHPGLGGLDIFSVGYNGNTASNLQNLGANLNSNADDFSLVLDQTNQSGYFATNRDGFVDNIFSVIIHKLDFVYIGELVASLGEDVTDIPVLVKKDGVVIDTLFADENGKFEFKGNKESAYVFEINDNEFAPVSDNYSTVGKTKSDTTYNTFDLSPKYIDVATTVFDDMTKEPLANTKVDFVNKETGEITSLTTDDKGQVNAKLLRNANYELKSAHKGYKDHLSDLSTVSKSKSIDASVPMKVMELASYLNLNMEYVRFKYDKWSLSSQFKGELDKIADYLDQNEDVKIELSSFTDSRGTEKYNMKLSERRSNSCVKYLISKGVEKSRLVSKWYGESQLVNHCSDDVECSEDEHQANRRTEFLVIYE